MNHIHRLVWNARLGIYVAVAESARRAGKRSGVSGALVAAVLLGGGLAAQAGAAPPPKAQAQAARPAQAAARRIGRRRG